MNIGGHIKVKNGIKDPDFSDLKLSGVHLFQLAFTH